VKAIGFLAFVQHSTARGRAAHLVSRIVQLFGLSVQITYVCMAVGILKMQSTVWVNMDKLHSFFLTIRAGHFPTATVSIALKV
jgi:hypothetical protein